MAVTTSYAVEIESSTTIPTYQDQTGATDSFVLGLTDGGYIAGVSEPDGYVVPTFYDADGTALSSDINNGEGTHASLAQLSDLSVVMVENGPGGSGVLFSLYSATGQNNGDATRVIVASGASGESNANVAALTGGNFVIVDQKEITAGDHNIEIHIRGNDGAAVTSFEIDGTSDDDKNAVVTGLTDGGFAVAYEHNGKVYTGTFNANGTVHDAVAALDAFGPGDNSISITPMTDGGYAVTYVSAGGFLGLAAFGPHGFGTVGLASGVTGAGPLVQLAGGLFGATFTTLDGDIHMALFDPSTSTYYGDQGGGGSGVTAYTVIDGTADNTGDPSLSLLTGDRFITAYTDTTSGEAIQSLYQFYRVQTGDDDSNTFTGDSHADHEIGGAGIDTLNGNGGNDFIEGKGGADIIDTGAGKDKVDGGAGLDTIYAHGYLTAADKIDGGADLANVVLDGDYSTNLTLDATTLVNIAKLQLTGGSSYNLTFDDAMLAASQILNVEGVGLTSGDTVTLDGSAEVSGSFFFDTGAAAANLTGGGGSDWFKFGANFSNTDTINGGGEDDTLELNGDYISDSLIFTDGTLTNVERVLLDNNHDYYLILAETTVATDAHFLVDGSALGATDTLTLSAAADTDSSIAVKGGDANDTFYYGLGYSAGDSVDGGDGNDTLVLAGSNNALNITGAMLLNVETLTLLDNTSYTITLADAVIGSGKSLTVDASALATPRALTLNAAAERGGILIAQGGAGNDAITGGRMNDQLSGGSGNDTLTISAGGDDTVHGEAGKDTIAAGGGLTATDRIDGGSENDVLTLDGNYAAGLTFGNTTLTSIETISVATGHSYKLVFNNKGLAAGVSLIVDGSHLAANNVLTADGTAERDGSFTMKGGAGKDVLTSGSKDDVIAGGDGNDTINLNIGGNDTAKGGNGNDTFNMGAQMKQAEKIDGGAGLDTVVLNGNASFAFDTQTMVNVETLKFTAGHTYSFNINDAMIAKNQTLTIDGSTLGAKDIIQMFFIDRETNGSFNILGGAAADQLGGGHGNDRIAGGLGADAINASIGGHDMLVYTAAAQSTGAKFDTITGVDFNKDDKFDLNVKVTGIDAAVSGGSVSVKTFDKDMAKALDATHLKAHHAVLFTPNAGNDAHTYLVIDANGKAGYQAGLDYVITLDNAGHLTSLDITDFT